MPNFTAPIGHEELPPGHSVSLSVPRIAILIPCFNEELTIGGVIDQFRKELPQADVYVFDNNSTDQTVTRAREKGRSLGCIPASCLFAGSARMIRLRACSSQK